MTPLDRFLRDRRSSGDASVDPLAEAPMETERATHAGGGAFADVETGLGDIVGRAGRILFGCFVLFALWACFYPLASAVISPGSLVSDGFNKVIQHPSGGRIVEIVARDGDRLEKGDVIARLDPAEFRAELTRLEARRATLRAVRERLEAEKAEDGVLLDPMRTSSIDGMSQLRGSFESDLWEEQFRAFRQGRVSLSAQIDALNRQRDATRAEGRGLEERIQVLRRQIGNYRDEVEGVRRLVDDGHIARRELWQAEARLFDARSQLAALVSQRDMAVERLGEIDAERRRLDGDTAREGALQLTDIIGELGQIEDQIVAARQSLEQSDLRAPVGGTLTGSTLTTEGAVVPPRETIAEIVPGDGRMIFIGRLAPPDIDHVLAGNRAEIELTAFNARLTDRLEGEIVYIAADSVPDERTGAAFFPIHIALEKAALSDRLRVGMAGTAFIAGPSRSFFSYVFQPLLDGYRHAFREWG